VLSADLLIVDSCGVELAGFIIVEEGKIGERLLVKAVFV